VAFPSWTLISLADWRTKFTAGGEDQDSNIEEACAAATLAIEAETQREFIARTTTVTEYHSLSFCDKFEDLYTGEYPINAATVVSVHEDTGWPRTYGAGSLLVAGTDYEVVGPDRLRRIGSAGCGRWATGTRVVRLVYVPGYTQTTVPYDLKQAAFAVAATIFAENDRKAFGISARTDASGSYTRFAGNYITPAVKELLRNYYRKEFHRTWER
jgi:hypothetical protein